MRNLTKPVYILSGARDGDTPAQAIARTRALRAEFDALGYASAECHGMYKGKAEPSIMIVDAAPGSNDTERDVLGLARKYRQESVLAVDAMRHASLVFIGDGRRVALGPFRNVSRDAALQRDAYTTRAGQYYVCGYTS